MERVFCNQVCIKEVSTYLGLPVKDVKEILDCQSEYTKVVIESGSFDNIRWPYLGVFKSKTKEIQLINYIKGMDYLQAEEFKKAVRTGKIKLQPNKRDDNTRPKDTTGINP